MYPPTPVRLLSNKFDGDSPDEIPDGDACWKVSGTVNVSFRFTLARLTLAKFGIALFCPMELSSESRRGVDDDDERHVDRRGGRDECGGPGGGRLPGEDRELPQLRAVGPRLLGCGVRKRGRPGLQGDGRDEVVVADPEVNHGRPGHRDDARVEVRVVLARPRPR